MSTISVFNKLSAVHIYIVTVENVINTVPTEEAPAVPEALQGVESQEVVPQEEESQEAVSQEETMDIPVDIPMPVAQEETFRLDRLQTGGDLPPLGRCQLPRTPDGEDRGRTPPELQGMGECRSHVRH